MEKLVDFTPTQQQITLHGLGFIQVKLPADQRLHVWHPDLPRRACFEHSPIHNHRFGFRSQIIGGTQVNQRVMMREAERGDHDIISHDGPRTATGSRLSYVAGRAEVLRLHPTSYGPGESYTMEPLEYHLTPNEGVVITLMTKLVEGKVHANSLIRHGYEFDQAFDRFQLSEAQLWAIVVDAFEQVAQGPSQ